MGTCSICKQQIRMIKNNEQVRLLCLSLASIIINLFFRPNHMLTTNTPESRSETVSLGSTSIHSRGFFFSKICFQENWLFLITFEMHQSFIPYRKLLDFSRQQRDLRTTFKSPHASLLVLGAVIFSCDLSQINNF